MKFYRDDWHYGTEAQGRYTFIIYRSFDDGMIYRSPHGYIVPAMAGIAMQDLNHNAVKPDLSKWSVIGTTPEPSQESMPSNYAQERARDENNLPPEPWESVRLPDMTVPMGAEAVDMIPMGAEADRRFGQPHYGHGCVGGCQVAKGLRDGPCCDPAL